MRNIARELQTLITNYLNEQITQVTFLSEDSKDIEFEIKNNLQKIGLACVVMTPSFEYIGRTKEGQAWDIKGLTIMMTEYVPMNRAKNKTDWYSGFDVAFEVTDKLAGPNANCGFGKFCPVDIEQGEDNGLLVVKATFDCSVVSKFDEHEETVSDPVLTPSSTSFTDTLTITMSCETEGAEIRYTLDGTEPFEGSTLYIAPVEIYDTTTIKAKAFKENFNPSNVVSEEYTKPEPVWGEGQWTIDTIGTAEYFPEDDEYYYQFVHGERYFTVPKNGQIELYIYGRKEGFWDSTDFDRTRTSQYVSFVNRDSGQTRVYQVFWEEQTT